MQLSRSVVGILELDFFVFQSCLSMQLCASSSCVGHRGTYQRPSLGKPVIRSSLRVFGVLQEWMFKFQVRLQDRPVGERLCLIFLSKVCKHLNIDSTW